MKITRVVNALRFVLQYAAIIVVIVEVLEFAISKLEKVTLPKRVDKPLEVVIHANDEQTTQNND